MSEPPKTGTIHLHTWRDFTKVMKIMSDGRWIFRGHKSVSYHLDSGLDRYIADIVTAREKRGMKTDVKSFALTLPRAEHFAVANFRLKELKRMIEPAYFEVINRAAHELVGLFEKTIERQATRLSTVAPLTQELLIRIEPEDIPAETALQ